MLIECIAKVSGTVETAISNDVYVFRPDAQGRLVCDVDREDHQRAFLSVEGVYREVLAAAPEDAPAPILAPDLTPVSPEDLEGKTWGDLAALYEAKYDRKPHSKSSVATLIERLTA